MDRFQIVCRYPTSRNVGLPGDLCETLGLDTRFRSVGLEPVYHTRQPREEYRPASEYSQVSDPFVVCVPVGPIAWFGIDRRVLRTAIP